MGRTDKGVVLLPQMETFSNIESRIVGAVQRGEDSVVQSLDREMDPLLDQILQHRARDAVELHAQLKFITDLVLRYADDPARVVRFTARLNALMQDYFSAFQQERPLAPPLQPELVPMAADIRHFASRSQADFARVAVISGEYRFLYCNDALAGDFRYTPGLLTGRSLLEFCDRAVFEADYRAHLDMCLAGAIREFTAVGLAGHKADQPMSVRLTPLRNIERRISGAVLVARHPHG